MTIQKTLTMNPTIPPITPLPSRLERRPAPTRRTGQCYGGSHQPAHKDQQDQDTDFRKGLCDISV